MEEPAGRNDRGGSNTDGSDADYRQIDHDLMAQALKVGGFKTRKAAVEAGLRLLVRTRAQGRLRELRGKLHWEGSLEEMRRDR